MSTSILMPRGGAIAATSDDLRIHVRDSRSVGEQAAFDATACNGCEHPGRDLRWLQILEEGLGQRPYLIQAVQDGRAVGQLPLAYVQSFLFGKFLVGLPYLNLGGIQAENQEIATLLIDRAVDLANELDCNFLELRHEERCEHPAFTAETTHKVHMRLNLPANPGALWDGFNCKVRNQVRKGQKAGFEIRWGGADLLDDFYAVFSRNMRDLGVPVFGKRLFAEILKQFGNEAEICGIYDQSRCVAAGVLIHGNGVTDLPSASSLREYKSSNANMLLYWNLLERAVERGQQLFDFGRSTRDSNTYRFKAQWGAVPHPAVWQYYVRRGAVDVVKPENPRNQRIGKIWKQLPLALTQWIGPQIVRGIP